MAEVGDAFVTIVPSLKGGAKTIQSELDGTMGPAGDKAGKKFGGAFSKSAGKIASGLAGLAIVSKATGLLKEAVANSSDLSESMSKTAQIFGKQAVPALDKFAKGAAKGLGQSRIQALDAASTFATFGKSAGLSGDDLVGFSTKFTTLASDLASFHNSSPQEAIDAIGAALRGESEPMRRFGVLLDDASLRAEALRLGIIKTTKQALTPQQKVLASQALIFKQTKDAQGDFARTSDGLANSQRILAATTDNLKTKLGDQFAPVIAKVVPVVQMLVDKFAASPTALTIVAVIVGGVLVGAFIALAVAVIAATWPFLLLGIALAALAVLWVLLWKKSDLFRSMVKAIGVSLLGLAANFLWLTSKVAGTWATMLGALSKAPGFGWAKGAAKALRSVADGAKAGADKADELAEKLKKVPKVTNPKVTTPKLKGPLADIGSLGKNIKNLPPTKKTDVKVNSLKTPIDETKTLKTNLDALPTSKTITVTTNYKTTGTKPAGSKTKVPGATATGGLFKRAAVRLIGEDGPEAVVPLNRPLSQVDPAVRALSAYAQGKTDMSSLSSGSASGGAGLNRSDLDYLANRIASLMGLATDGAISDELAFAGTMGRMNR